MRSKLHRRKIVPPPTAEELKSVLANADEIRRGAAFNRGNSKQDYATPADFMRAVEKRFGPLAFDLAADASNAKAARYFTVEQDSLAQDWTALDLHDWTRHWAWLNPPFDRIEPWARKCAESKHAVDILFLVPAAVGANWWRDWVHKEAAVLFLNGRLSFDGKNPYPKDCALCTYSRRVVPGYDVWNWRGE